MEKYFINEDIMLVVEILNWDLTNSFSENKN